MGHFLIGENREETLQKWRLLDVDGLMGITVLPFIGHGSGPSKTTTVIDGLAIAEEMSIGDELYILWHFPHHLDKTKDVELDIGWYLNASESGKLISGDIDFAFTNGGDLVTVVTDTYNMVDEPAPSTAFMSISTKFMFPLATYLLAAPNASHMHIRLKRVASSNDPVAHPRLHHMSIMYWKEHL